MKELYQRYLSWCEGERSNAASKRAFSDMMVERGFDRANGAKNAAIFQGITLRDRFAEGVDHAEG